jgi:hypothetical protein
MTAAAPSDPIPIHLLDVSPRTSRSSKSVADRNTGVVRYCKLLTRRDFQLALRDDELRDN